MALKPTYSVFVPRWLMRLTGFNDRAEGGCVGFDAGVQYDLSRAVSLGFSLQNVGPDLAYSPVYGTQAQPLLIRAGLDWHPRTGGPVDVALVSDVSKDLVSSTESVHGDEFLSTWEAAAKGIGLELRFFRLANVRLGYVEDLPHHGGIIMRVGDNSPYSTSLLRYLVGHPVGKPVGFGMCWGVGVEYHGMAVDIGADNDDWGKSTWPSLRLQLSYRARKE
jgi:hypothetical protein